MKSNPEYKEKMNLRSEERKDGGENASVEFMPANHELMYHFKLKDFSSKGFGILVRKDSRVLKYIKCGDILDMRYHPDKAIANPESHRTEIRHISEPDQGTHKDHMVVGLMILD